MVARRPCHVCLEVAYDEETGLPCKLSDGTPEKRILNGDKCFLAPCRDPSRGCPKGTPENPKTLNERNQVCYEHYRECKAVGKFPDDPVVRRNAAVIREQEERFEQFKENRRQEDLIQIVISQKVKQ